MKRFVTRTLRSESRLADKEYGQVTPWTRPTSDPVSVTPPQQQPARGMTM